MLVFCFNGMEWTKRKKEIEEMDRESEIKNELILEVYFLLNLGLNPGLLDHSH